MNRTCLLLAVGVMCGTVLPGQAQQGVEALYQQSYLQALGGVRGGNAMPMPRAEAGKPFSATATTQTSQILTDGTHVSQTSRMVEYRDAEGRIRTETSQTNAQISIRDTVAGVNYTLDPIAKSAVKTTGMASLPAFAGIPGLAGVPLLAAAGGSSGFGGRGGRGGSGGRGGGVLPIAQAPLDVNAFLAQKEQSLKDVLTTRNNIVEDLGTMTINGVAARGTRTTTIVPAEAIGNDREFRSVSERWFSSELNLLVKSISTDPRFGTTTYELTNISRLPPNPSLFQVPADYSVISR